MDSLEMSLKVYNNMLLGRDYIDVKIFINIIITNTILNDVNLTIFKGFDGGEVTFIQTIIKKGRSIRFIMRDNDFDLLCDIIDEVGLNDKFKVGIVPEIGGR